MNYIVLIAAFGAIVLLTAWLPLILKKAPLTLPIICVAIGAVAFAPGLGVIAMPNLKQNLPAVERVTELVVILYGMARPSPSAHVQCWNKRRVP